MTYQIGRMITVVLTGAANKNFRSFYTPEVDKLFTIDSKNAVLTCGADRCINPLIQHLNDLQTAIRFDYF